MVDTQHGKPATPDLADAHWFPIDLDVKNGRYGFVELDDAVLARSSFLDTRIETPLSDAIAVNVEGQAFFRQRHASADDGPAWLFHTSFCGSTLLARALHLPPHQVCLREPLVLRRLSDAQDAGVAYAHLVQPTLMLLNRPWHRDGRVVVKPTHAALNIAHLLLAATPDGRGIVLTSSLDDFLVSNLKKTADSQAKIPELTERAARASGFHARLGRAAMEPPDLLCAAGLQWAAQRELMWGLTKSFGERLRLLDMDAMLMRFERTVLDCTKWLHLPAPEHEVQAHCREVFARHAKAVETPYGPQRRRQEAEFIENLYGEALARAKSWLAQHVIPAMTPEAVADPTPWTSP